MLERLTLTPKGFACTAAFALLLLVSTVGCNRGPRMYQVKGQVSFKNGSVPKAPVCVVYFQPSKDSAAVIKKGASGAINPDGSFELTTRVAGDGVYEGKYDVGFNVLTAAVGGKPLLADKYMNPATSGHTVTVDGNQSDLKFEIETLPGVAAAKGG
jgi:hypothetical protein